MRETLVGEMTKKSSRHWDVFVSYASEDRRHVVAPLVEALLAAQLDVWYDRFELKIGDSLRRKLDEGLSCSDYGIVILSPKFFAKHFTNLELNGLAQREVNGRKVILPVWYNVDAAIVREYSPSLADRIARNWQEGVSVVVEEILKEVRPDRRSADISLESNAGRPSVEVFTGRQGDKCPRCEQGVMLFEKWSPGPAGPFTAYYRCTRCQTVFPSYQEFDGGLI